MFAWLQTKRLKTRHIRSSSVAQGIQTPSMLHPCEEPHGHVGSICPPLRSLLMTILRPGSLLWQWFDSWHGKFYMPQAQPKNNNNNNDNRNNAHLLDHVFCGQESGHALLPDESIKDWPELRPHLKVCDMLAGRFSSFGAAELTFPAPTQAWEAHPEFHCHVGLPT